METSYIVKEEQLVPFMGIQAPVEEDTIDKIERTYFKLIGPIKDELTKIPAFFEEVISILKSSRKAPTAFKHSQIRKEIFREATIEQLNILTMSMDTEREQLQQIFEDLSPKPEFILMTLKRFYQATNNEYMKHLYTTYISDIIHPLCNTCYPLVIHIAKRFPNLDMNERIEEGYRGLVEAAHKYDLSYVVRDENGQTVMRKTADGQSVPKRISFGTFASPWITTRIHEAVLNHKYMLTVNQGAMMNALRKNIESYCPTLAANLQRATALFLEDMRPADDDGQMDTGVLSTALQSNPDYIDISAKKAWDQNGRFLMEELLTPHEFFVVTQRLGLFTNEDEKSMKALKEETGLSEYKLGKTFETAIKKIKRDKELCRLLEEML